MLAHRFAGVGALAGRTQAFGYSRAMLGVDRRFGGLTATLTTSMERYRSAMAQLALEEKHADWT